MSVPCLRRAANAALGAALLLVVGATPARGQEQERECGDRAELRVTVVDESGVVPLAGAAVVVQWMNTGRRPARGRAGDGGRYSVCAPGNASGAVLWAEIGRDASREVTVALEPGTARDVELRVVFAMSRPGRLLGRIYDAMTEDPVATAAISLVGRPGFVESNRQGEFAVADIPPGERQLEVRRLGYAPLGFYERRHWGELLGLGEFFTVEGIERWRPARMSAVEVYRGPAQLPARFAGSDSRCGVVAIGTK